MKTYCIKCGDRNGGARKMTEENTYWIEYIDETILRLDNLKNLFGFDDDMDSAIKELEGYKEDLQEEIEE